MEELDLKELFDMFWTKKVHILLITLIFMVVGIIYSYVFVTPDYKAYTSLLLATEETDKGSTTITTSDISINNNLVATYNELIQSKTVLSEVINSLGIDKTADALKSKVSVSTEKSTQMIRINVTDRNPYQAKIIANEIAKVFINKVSEYYHMNNVHMVDEAEEPTSPYNINHIKDIAIFAFIGVVVAGVYVLIANMLDTTVKTQEDVEKKLRLTVLTTIPLNNFDEPVKRNTKGGRK